MKTTFFTGRGDEGSSLIGKQKLQKNQIEFQLLGELDELNSWLGLCRVEAKKVIRELYRSNIEDVAGILKNIQETLFIAQAEVASIAFQYPLTHKVVQKKTEDIEEVIKRINKVLPPILTFIIPGETELAGRIDYARALSRRVERTCVAFHGEKEVSPYLLQFLNRLSSVLFALARYSNHVLGVKESSPEYS
ncbi:MAG: ATP:cob(I)alamin adenosyltransferase [Candidatus Harrisonbacteria bacterium RIFCSPLOWO2_01_FULL_40_28]|uniref:Corrinoid adenosyltransferase n=1 Tax=Candidatus Harrisonbacteria bacterium RIFCSPLOWO2_01_FULL_40_28 TaxID=1798406 RepID=A0A1G1ZRH6_9BACT|nr:MAG: ATP:cob(I)alamin adenosyltransferase [Candidatus Harrisonbacteria bacterium RIFCSPLOWO2_01_FULL_40_28]